MLRHLKTAGIIGAMAILGGTPAIAAADGAERQVPNEVRQAVARMASTGTLSAADRALIEAHPHIADTVVDPAAVNQATSVKPAPGRSDGFGVQGGPGCWIGNHTVTGRYVSGGVAYRYTYRVDWCETSTAVKKPHYRNHSVELFDFMEQRGVVEDWVTPSPSATVETKRKIEIENCPPLIPCFNSDYPWVKWTLRAGHISGDYASGGVDG